MGEGDRDGRDQSQLPEFEENDPEVLRAHLKDSWKQNDRLLSKIRELEAPAKVGRARRAANALRRLNVPVASPVAATLLENWKPVVAGGLIALVGSQLLLIGLSLGDRNTWPYKEPWCHGNFSPRISVSQEPAMPFANVPIGVDGHWIRPPEDTSPTTEAIAGQAKQAFATIHDPCQADAFSIFGWKVLEQKPLDHVTVTMVPVPDGKYVPPDFGSQVKLDIPDKEKMSNGFYGSLDPTHLTPLKSQVKQNGNEVTFLNTVTGDIEFPIEPQGQLTPKDKHDTWNMEYTYRSPNFPLGDGKVHTDTIGHLTVDTTNSSDPRVQGVGEYFARWLIKEAEVLPNLVIDDANRRIQEIENWLAQFGQYVPGWIKDNWPNLPTQLPEIQLDDFFGRMGRAEDYVLRNFQHVSQHAGDGINETVTGWCVDVKVCSVVGGQGDTTGQPTHGGLH